MNVLLEKAALHVGIKTVYSLKGLHHGSISLQVLILFREKDLPRLRLGKV